MRRLVRVAFASSLVMAFGVACNLIAGHEAPLRVIVIDERDAGDEQDSKLPRPPERPDVVTCPSGQVACGAACISVGNDVDNCGRCGRRCGSAPCIDGRCPASVIASIGPYAGGIADRGDFVYWTTDSDGTLKRMPKAGGSPQTLATMGFAPSGLVPRDGFIYVATQNGTVSRVPEDGGTPYVLGHLYKAAGIGLHEDRILVTSHHAPNGEIGWVEIDGGATKTIAAGQNSLFIVATDTRVYFTSTYDLPSTPTDERGVWRVAWNGMGLTQVLTSGIPAGLAIDDVGVYTAAHKDGTLVRIEHESGNVVSLGSQSDVAGVVADSTYLYFATTSGAVGKVPKKGGHITILAVGPTVEPGAGFMTVDETTLYWTATQKIVRTAK